MMRKSSICNSDGWRTFGHSIRLEHLCNTGRRKTVVCVLCSRSSMGTCAASQPSSAIASNGFNILLLLRRRHRIIHRRARIRVLIPFCIFSIHTSLPWPYKLHYHKSQKMIFIQMSKRRQRYAPDTLCVCVQQADPLVADECLRLYMQCGIVRERGGRRHNGSMEFHSVLTHTAHETKGACVALGNIIVTS